MTITKRVKSYVRTIPYDVEITSRSVAEGTGYTMKQVQGHIRGMRQDGTLLKVREEAGVGGRRLRYVYVRAGSKVPQKMSGTFLDQVLHVRGASDRDLLDALTLLTAEAGRRFGKA